MGRSPIGTPYKNCKERSHVNYKTFINSHQNLPRYFVLSKDPRDIRRSIFNTIDEHIEKLYALVVLSVVG